MQRIELTRLYIRKLQAWCIDMRVRDAAGRKSNKMQHIKTKCITDFFNAIKVKLILIRSIFIQFIAKSGKTGFLFNCYDMRSDWSLREILDRQRWSMNHVVVLIWHGCIDLNRSLKTGEWSFHELFSLTIFRIIHCDKFYTTLQTVRCLVYIVVIHMYISIIILKCLKSYWTALNWLQAI